MSINPDYNHLIKNIKSATENYHSQKEFLSKLNWKDEAIQQVAAPEFKAQYQQITLNLQKVSSDLSDRITELESYYKEHKLQTFLDFFKYLFKTSPLTRAKRELQSAGEFLKTPINGEDPLTKDTAKKQENDFDLNSPIDQSLKDLKKLSNGINDQITTQRNMEGLLNFLESPSDEEAKEEILRIYNEATPNEQLTIFSNVEALKNTYMDGRLTSINLSSYAREIKSAPGFFLDLLPKKDI